MPIHVKVIPAARKNEIKKEGELYRVYLTAPAQDGRANQALIEALATYFGVKKRQIQIIKGLKSRLKTINISSNI